MIFSQDYTTNVHRYMVKEAWEYLKLKTPGINWNSTQLAANIYPDGCGNPERPWETGSVIIGSCREDEECPVYFNVWKPHPTVTHFWKGQEIKVLINEFDAGNYSIEFDGWCLLL
jgi:hypothetical protein